MTVSNAYGHPERVAPTTRAAVLAAADRLGYAGPSPAGRSLRRGSSGVVGVLIGDDLPYLFADPGAAAFMQGLATEASARDLALQIIHASGTSAARQIADAVVDAWVTFGIPAEHPALAALLERRQRIVTAPGPRLAGQPMVTVDAVAAAESAVEHLVALGHRRFVLVIPPTSGSPTWRERLRGGLAAIQRAGFDESAVRVIECARNSRAEGRAAGPAALHGARRRSPLGIFAATDVLALGVLDAARAVGVIIPRDASVVGFDDVDEASVSSPPLTTVRQDLCAQGARAAALASGGTRPRRLVETFPTELVVRDSTARVPSGRSRRDLETW